jgi:hypothetical protein
MYCGARGCGKSPSGLRGTLTSGNELDGATGGKSNCLRLDGRAPTQQTFISITEESDGDADHSSQ